MSEADWWVCVRCQSLNSLSARKCYSCRNKKPKVVARASDVLGYRVRESWDGKVRLEQQQPVYLDPPAPPPEPAPLRDPIPRKVVAVAPPPPRGARITYRQTIPGPDEPRLRQPMPPPPAVVRVASPVSDAPQAPPPTAPVPAPAATASPSALADRHPMAAAPPPPPPTAPPPTAATPPPPPAPPPLVPTAPAWIVAADERQRMAAVGPGLPATDGWPAPPSHDSAAPGQTPRWAHWRDLLDGPVPDGERLRATFDESDVGTVPTSTGSLSRAIRGARAKRSGGESAWPTADRPSQSPDDEAAGPAEEAATAS